MSVVDGALTGACAVEGVDAALSTSSFMIRPFVPDPCTFAGSIPVAAATLRATGVIDGPAWATCGAGV